MRRSGYAPPSRAAARRQACHRGIALLLSGLLGASRGAGAAPAERGEVVRLPAGSVLLDGTTLRPDDWRDRVLVVVFFSTTCPYCARHERRLERLAQVYGGRGLVVLGVAVDDDTDGVRRHRAALGVGFPMTRDAASWRAALTVRRLVPMTCVIDRSGRLREVIPGEMAEDDVMALARWLDRA